MKGLFRLLGAAALVTGLAAQLAAEPVKTRYSTVDLLLEQASLPAAGGSVTIGFLIEPDASWHAYWINPGDAGMAPSIDWELPDGFSVSDFAFPTPHLLPFGELNTYGYEEPILLLAELSVPAGLDDGEPLVLGGSARWVVCDDEICVPEQADLSVQAVVGDAEVDAVAAERFRAARARLPQPVDWPASYRIEDGEVRIEIDTGDTQPDLDSVYLYVESTRLVQYGRQSAGFTRAGLSISMDAGRRAEEADATRAVLVFAAGDGQRAVTFDVRPGGDTSGSAVAAAVATDGGMHFLQAALFAFIGGIILNLMPCVFPILSMKALGLVNTAHGNRRAARESGLIYTLGILLAFAAIGIGLLAIRSAGEAVGWGFQLQNPLVNAGLGLLMVAIAMNLLGVFEIGTRIMGVGQGLTEGGERRSAFFTGLLAVVVATPCTAPFMAGALAYALAQPALLAMAIFLALGFGLAFPYLLVSFLPAVGRLLPKPGAWMETFRHLLAFPMFLTALWLFWVVGKQLGATSMTVALLAALGLAFALFAYGRGMRGRRMVAWYLTAVAGLAACVFAFLSIEENRVVARAPDDYSAGTLGGLELEHFDPDRLLAYIEAGQPTFVYFTADWCISCKANERVALSTDTVAAAFAERGIKVVEGDWTTEDPVITEWLARYDRVGVPLYLYFPSGSSLQTATILPQILTPGIVVDAIAAADAGSAPRAAIASADDRGAAAEVVVQEPDWSIVEAYLDVDAAWHAAKSGERGEHPDVVPAQGAATAIVRDLPDHPRAADAAAFLVTDVVGAPDWEASIRLGFETLIERHRDYGDWPRVLYSADFYTEPGIDDWADRLFEDFEFLVADQPVAVATARYYAASRKLRLANAVATPAAERDRHRERAAELASRLSAGVEDAELVKRRRYTDDGEPIPFPTLAEAERDLVYNIEHLTVGSTIPEVEAARLDGDRETISAYRGQAVLLDFWATWCGPCIDSLPSLNALDTSLPEREFEILSISVDEFVDTVTEFQEERPMPWSHWHVGPDGDLLGTWAVRGYPTYILLDHDGRIVARQHDLNDDFKALIRATACGPTGAGTC